MADHRPSPGQARGHCGRRGRGPQSGDPPDTDHPGHPGGAPPDADARHPSPSASGPDRARPRGVRRLSAAAGGSPSSGAGARPCCAAVGALSENTADAGDGQRCLTCAFDRATPTRHARWDLGRCRPIALMVFCPQRSGHEGWFGARHPMPGAPPASRRRWTTAPSSRTCNAPSDMWIRRRLSCMIDVAFFPPSRRH